MRPPSYPAIGSARSSSLSSLTRTTCGPRARALRRWHLTGDYDNATAEGLPISKTLGTMPAGVAGFEHTRYMFHRISHPKTAVDLEEVGCTPGAASDSSNHEASSYNRIHECVNVHRLASLNAGATAACSSERVTWQNPRSTTVLLSNDVPCTAPHRHYVTNAIFRWGWNLLERHLRENASAGFTASAGASSASKPALIVFSLPDPHPSEGGYVVRTPYNRYYRTSLSSSSLSSSSSSSSDRSSSSSFATSAAAEKDDSGPEVSGNVNVSTALPSSFLDPTPLVTTDVKPYALRQRELALGRWRQQHITRVVRMRQAYAGMTKVIDDCVGVLVDQLRRASILGSSLIVFTSDHGDLLGAHGLRGKMTTYDEAVRVPLLLHWPERIPAGVAVRRTLAASTDVLPTLAGLLGLYTHPPSSPATPSSRFDSAMSDGVDLHTLVLRRDASDSSDDPTSLGQIESDGVSFTDSNAVRVTSGGVAYVGVVSQRWWLTVESPERARSNGAYHERGTDPRSFSCVADLTAVRSGDHGGGRSTAAGDGSSRSRSTALGVSALGASAAHAHHRLPSCRLWDRSSDVAQTHNVYHAQPAVVRSMLAALHRHVLFVSDALDDSSSGDGRSEGGSSSAGRLLPDRRLHCRRGAVINCTQAAVAFQYTLGFVLAPESLMCHTWYRELITTILDPTAIAGKAASAALSDTATRASAGATSETVSPLLCPLQWRDSWGSALSKEKAMKAFKRASTSAHFRSSDRASKVTLIDVM